MQDFDMPDSAFPVDTNRFTTFGLSRRDYFAAKAMNGLLSNLNLENTSLFGDYTQILAEMSFKMADAMMEQSKK